MTVNDRKLKITWLSPIKSPYMLICELRLKSVEVTSFTQYQKTFIINTFGRYVSFSPLCRWKYSSYILKMAALIWLGWWLPYPRGERKKYESYIVFEHIFYCLFNRIDSWEPFRKLHRINASVEPFITVLPVPRAKLYNHGLWPSLWRRGRYLLKAVDSVSPILYLQAVNYHHRPFSASPFCHC